MNVETYRSYGHHRNSRMIVRHIAQWCNFIFLTWLLPSVAFGAVNTLTDMSYSALPGNKVQFRLTLSSPLAEKPSSFATDTPARLVLDFPDVGVALPNRTLPIGVGVAHSVSAVEAGGRTRVVFNLNEMVPYQLDLDQNQLILTLDSGLAMVEQATSNTQTSLPRREGDLQAIDFRRGAGGEGQVIITLAAPDTLVDVREEGAKIILDILDTGLPDRLHQRLDVVDFATPVQTIESEAVGDNVKVSVAATGEFEYIAYQADNLYTLEFRPLTKAEQEEQLKKKNLYTGERLSLNFQDIEVRAVLQLLGDFTNLNMVVSDTVTGNITLRLKNVPWDQALDIILKTKGLSMRKNENVILVAPTVELLAQELLELSKQHEITELAPLKTELIQINYTKAEDLKNILLEKKKIKTKVSGNLPGGGSQAASTEEYVGMTSVRGMVTVDPRTNSLLITDTAEKLEDIRRLILKLDVPVRQVLIESRIVIANNDFARDLGVRFGWSGSRQAGDTEINISGGQPGYIDGTYYANKGPFLADVNGNPFNSGLALPNGTDQEALLVNLPATSPSGAINFLIGKIGSYLLQLELSAMQLEGRGEIISSPRVVTADKNKATIKAGTEIPYQEASASGATTVSFKEAVLQLQVTPHITPDDRIMMDLEIKKENPDWSRSVLGTPPIDTRSIKTNALVDNGETVVLGGIFERSTSSNKEQVPFFGDIPVLGHLFKRDSSVDSNTELLIFITPKILKETLTAR